MIDHLDRAREGCLCCNSTNLHSEDTIISPCLAYRAWGGMPEITQILNCLDCGFRFYRRGLLDEEASRYYAGYRDEDYYKTRNHYEPFYTRSAHNGLLKWSDSDARREALAASLKKAGLPDSFKSVLDYGGGKGQLIRWLKADRKAVFDLSRAIPEAGVEGIYELAKIGDDWELIISSQVFEHLSDPSAACADIISRIAHGGFFYVEVPDEPWNSHVFPSKLRDRWLGFILQRPSLLLAVDIYSTAFRIKTKVLPPLGFIPMREHLNYFTPTALVALLGRHGLEVLCAGKNSEGQFFAVAQKVG